MVTINTNLKDITGITIKLNDILEDNVPSKGIVMFHEGELLLTTNFEGRDIQSTDTADKLDQALVDDNHMRIIGNVVDNLLNVFN